MMARSPALRRLGRTLAGVWKTRYPCFLFGLPLKHAEIPVFTYHDVDPESFTQDLIFLKENGYRTLTTDEFIRLNGRSDSERAVLLTFDDAPRNFWDVVFPLLKQFNAKATVFVPTDWINGTSNLQEQANKENHSRDYFMTWDHLRVCLRSGLVDVQSHAHRHALVFTSTMLVGFASPKLLAQHQLYDWPMRRAGGRDILGRPPLGTPIYEASPLLSADCRVLEDERAVQACQDYVAAGGGEAFFDRKEGNRQLRAVHDKACRRTASGSLMDVTEFRLLVESEFSLSRQLFESELGVRPRYFAFPWKLGSALSLQLAAEAGIQAVFGVGMDFRLIRRLKSPIPAHGRFKGDWLRFLPGRGRRKLQDVIPQKMMGFLSSQHLAH